MLVDEVVIELRDDADKYVLYKPQEIGHIAIIAELDNDTEITPELTKGIHEKAKIVAAQNNLRMDAEPFIRQGYSELICDQAPFWVWKIDQSSISADLREQIENADFPELK